MDNTEWDLIAVDDSGVLLLALNSGKHGGRCVIVDPSSGASRVLATLPWDFNPGWLVPTALYDRSARVMHSVVEPRGALAFASSAATTPVATAARDGSQAMSASSAQIASLSSRSRALICRSFPWLSPSKAA